MNWTELVRKTYKMCVDNADVVYHKPDPSTSKCYYTKGECDNGEVGCIFGQILKNEAGFDLDEYDKYSTGISYILDPIEYPYEVLQWCQNIQIGQDNGLSWGDALIEAEILFGKDVDQLLEEHNE